MSEKEYQAYIDELHDRIKLLEDDVRIWKQKCNHEAMKFNFMEQELARYREVLLSGVEKWSRS